MVMQQIRLLWMVDRHPDSLRLLYRISLHDCLQRGCWKRHSPALCL
jgi:hypothetical protein